MSTTQIIPAFSKNTVENLLGNDVLEISEFFFDTLQGENFVGVPSAFLRLQGCTLNCQWCDTTEVWRQGDAYSIPYVLDLIETFGLHTKLAQGQNLVITGGSPLKQQYRLLMFFTEFEERFGFKPYIQIENECTVMPVAVMSGYIDCWNNSPKLSNSGNSTVSRYKPNVIRTLAGFRNSWFKFVINAEEDWDEIQKDFLDTNLIKKSQIVLMPCGATKKELDIMRLPVANLAIKHGVRFTDRLHITLWDKKTGV